MTEQEEIWASKFGDDYVSEHSGMAIHEKLFYDKHGVSVQYVYDKMFGDLDRNYRILEVGCNVGHKLRRLQKMGFKNLYGLDVNEEAVTKGHFIYDDINFIHGTLNDLNPHEVFDIVMTNHVLIHVSPEFIKETLRKCYDFSARYLFHLEFDEDQEEMIIWKGKDNICWKRPVDEFYDGLRVERLKLMDLPRVEDNNFDTAILWCKY